MVMTDPIADFLTRMRNALRVRKRTFNIQASKVKIALSKILKEKGYIENFKIIENDKKKFIQVYLKYNKEGDPYLEEIKRVSKPGRRVYMGYKEMKPIKEGFGFRIVSTSRGIMTDDEARKRKLGGEVIAEIF